MAGIFNRAIFNDPIFNTAAATGVGGVWDSMQMGPPTTVKPWLGGEKEGPQEFELLIVIAPSMGQLFKKNLIGVPRLPQFKRRVLRVKAKPMMEEPMAVTMGAKPEYTRNSGLNVFSGARLHSEYNSPQIKVLPQQRSFFHKTLYGKTLHGKNIIAIVQAIIGDENPFTFEFKEAKKAWKGAQLDIETFSQSSTFVGRVIYDPETQDMSISLSNRRYVFCNVPFRTFEQFEGAPSKGKYFNSVIKGNFNC